MTTEQYLALSSLAYSNLENVNLNTGGVNIAQLITDHQIDGYYRPGTQTVDTPYLALSEISNWQLISFSKDTVSGFAGAAFRNPTTGEIVFSFRGTNPLDPRDDFTDLGIVVGGIAPQFDDAYNFVKSVMNKPGIASTPLTTDSALNTYLSNPTNNVTFTGH
ncbi:MAG: hypothetical protein WAQ24_02070, partial [Candidatus Saccharimonadales bacterium]